MLKGNCFEHVLPGIITTIGRNGLYPIDLRVRHPMTTPTRGINSSNIARLTTNPIIPQI